MSKRKAETEKDTDGKKGKLEGDGGILGGGGLDIKAIMTAEGPICQCVVLRATGAMEEIFLDFSPKERNVEKTLGGPVTFLGQWEDIEVIIVERKDQDDESLPISVHKMQPPFHEAEIRGDLLLYRCDDTGLPEDFNLEEYEDWQKVVIEPGDNDDDDEDEDEVQPGDDDDEDDEDDESDSDSTQALFEYLIQEHILKFTDEFKRPPTEEELEHLTELVQETIVERRRELEEEVEDDDEDDDDYGEVDAERDEEDEDFTQFKEHLVDQMVKKFQDTNKRKCTFFQYTSFHHTLSPHHLNAPTLLNSLRQTPILFLLHPPTIHFTNTSTYPITTPS